ncbi:MAG: HDIG domain-containing protein [Deltaproteobacteria bacterium]|nr:HDIG domain-containing protein [Deltaproteobacteria bacterium]
MTMPEKKISDKPKRPVEPDRVDRLWQTLFPGKWGPVEKERWRHWYKIVLLALFSLLAAVMVFPRPQTTQIDYQVGDIAEADIKATMDFLVEDHESTLKRKQEFLEESPLILDRDERVGAEIRARMHQAFEYMRQTIQEAQRGPAGEEAESAGAAKSAPKLPFSSLYQLLLEKKSDFDRFLGASLPNNIFYLLARNNFSVEWEDIISQQLDQVIAQGVFSEQTSLLADGRRPVIIRSLPSWQETVEKNPDRFVGLEEARKKVNHSCREALEDLPSGSRNAICEVAQSLVAPNVSLNRAETEKRKQVHMEEFRPVYFQVKKGEMLVREGERITPTHLVKLQALEKDRPQGWWFWRFLGTWALIALISGCFYKLIRLNPRKGPQNLSELTFIAVILLAITLLNLGLVVFGGASSRLSPLLAKNFMFYLPVALAPILVQVFIGLEAALMTAFVAAALTALLLETPFLFFLYFFLSGLVGIWAGHHCRNRWGFIRTGLYVSLANFAMVLALKLMVFPVQAQDVALGALFALAGGIQIGILATGLAPVMEVSFDLTSDVRLLELVNLERPILRQLMLVAPGTYHHSIIVGNMVEAAAEKIGANPLLAKAAAYYHDIGKIKKPTYFVENQLGGENKHEKLAPSMSSLILQAHVKDGVELARQNKVSQKIIDIIRQHHGTSFMAYFYNKAKQQAVNPQQVNIEDYRYPGPRPQTKEAGLVLLADQVEASSKTLLDPTPARIQGAVQKIINNIFADGQLDECELTLKDLHEIAKSFIKILSGIFHHRIEYPQAADKGDKKKNSEDLDKSAAEKDTVKPAKNQEKSREDLKRLGLS